MVSKGYVWGLNPAHPTDASDFSRGWRGRGFNGCREILVAGWLRGPKGCVKWN